MGLGSQRVFKKSSPDNAVTIYVEKRDFVDFCDRSEPIEGMVVVNRSAVGLKKVFAAVVATFRFGREEDEILGMTFCRELYLVHEQVYPPIKRAPSNASAATSSTTIEETSVTEEEEEEEDEEAKKKKGEATSLEVPACCKQKRNSLCERILQKADEESVNFRFQLPDNSPYSVAMQQNAKDSGDSCSVRYFIRCYVGTDENEKPSSAGTVNLAIRKLQYAPLRAPLQLPTANVTKDFPLSPGKLFLEATLNKSLYNHGEDILVTVLVQNYSNKTVKHIKITVVQVADICMFSTGRWKVNVASIDTNECCPISPGKTFQKRFTMNPNVDENKNKYGVFTQGRLTSEEDCLSSTTVVQDKDRPEYFGIIISYLVKVKIYLSTISPIPPSELSCILPFLLMHPDPNRVRESSRLLPGRTSHEDGDIVRDDSVKDEALFEKLTRGRMRSMSLVG